MELQRQRVGPPIGVAAAVDGGEDPAFRGDVQIARRVLGAHHTTAAGEDLDATSGQRLRQRHTVPAAPGFESGARAHVGGDGVERPTRWVEGDRLHDHPGRRT
jgi:hypothetical protein